VGVSESKVVNMMAKEEVQTRLTSKKGTWCPFQNNLYCQEGYCSDCHIYLDKYPDKNEKLPKTHRDTVEDN